MDLKTNIINRIFGMNKRKLGITIIIFVVVFLVLFPYIDTNFFYSNRIKNRITILQEITKLDMEKINNDENLLHEYNSILNEVKDSNSNYINKIFDNQEKNHIIGKFISGGLLWWFLGLTMILFYKENGKTVWKTRISGFILCVFCGLFTGLICSIMPTILNIWVNYIIIPILVLILMFIIFYNIGTSNNKGMFK